MIVSGSTDEAATPPKRKLETSWKDLVKSIHLQSYSTKKMEALMGVSNYQDLCKVLRIFETSRKRSILYVANAESLHLPNVTSVQDLKTAVSTQWIQLKAVYPFNCFKSKSEVLSDLNNQDISWLARSNNFKGDWIMLDEHMIECCIHQSVFMSCCAAYSIGLTSLGHFLSHKVKLYLQQQTLSDFARDHGVLVVDYRDKRPAHSPFILVSGDIVFTDKLGDFIFMISAAVQTEKGSLFSQIRTQDEPQYLKQFLKKARMPAGVLTKNDHFLVGPFSVPIYFHWYRQSHNGIIDTEQLFCDVCGVLRNGPPRDTLPNSGDVSLEEMCRTFGIQQGIDRFVNTIHKDRSYPENVLPIFSSTPYDSESTFLIHRHTGRFSDLIVGYTDMESGAKFMIQDVQQSNTSMRIKSDVYKKSPWLTSSLSAKDYCLLQASGFSQFRTKKWETLKKIFKNTKIRVKANDLTLIRGSDYTQKFVPIQKFKKASSKCCWSYIVDHFPWILAMEKDAVLDYQVMHGALTGDICVVRNFKGHIDLNLNEFQVFLRKIKG